MFDAAYSFPEGSRIFTVNSRSDSSSEKFVSVFGSMFMTAFNGDLCAGSQHFVNL